MVLIINLFIFVSLCDIYRVIILENGEIRFDYMSPEGTLGAVSNMFGK